MVELVVDFEFMLCIHVLAEKMVIHILAAHIGALAHDGQKVIIKQFAKICAGFLFRAFVFVPCGPHFINVYKGKGSILPGIWYLWLRFC